jgi:SAM-dependent methyltransferase
VASSLSAFLVFFLTAVLISLSSSFILFSFFIFWEIWEYVFRKNSYFYPTANRELEKIFSRLDIKNKKYFYDLGCGDGRILRLASRLFPKVTIIGYEINPFLCFYNRLSAKTRGLKITVKRQSFYQARLENSSVVYIFLNPEAIKRLEPKLTLLKNSTIVSHGFEIPYFKEILNKKLEAKPFSTYVYRV